MNVFAKLASAVHSLILAAIPFAVIAEDCATMGGCKGNVWFLHVPHAQIGSPAIFSAPGLPDVNRTERITREVALLDSSLFAHPTYALQFASELNQLKAQKGGVLRGWGTSLRADSRVRILSYHQFPSLGRGANELFAMVLVVSE